MTPKNQSSFVMIYPQNLHTPKNNDISETPKHIEIQDFKPPKMVQAYVYI